MRKIILIALMAVGQISLSQSNCVYIASDVFPGSIGGLPLLVTEYNGALYFNATGNNDGAELWKYENGVSTMVEDLNPGIAGSLPNQLTVFNGELYFTATTSTTGMELFKYDGVSISLAADIFPGVGGSQVSYLTVLGSELYFLANDGTTGMEPWKFDGVTATQLDDINPGSGGSNASGFAMAGGNVYFTAFDPSIGFEFCKYDGVSVTMYDLYPGPFSSDIGEITAIGSKVCFRATNGTQGYELWTHDGTTATCLDLCTTGPGDFTPWEITPFGSKVYFRGFIPADGYELWEYDGTTASMVADIYPGLDNSHPNNLTAGSSVLYFAANDGVTGNELWMFDGVSVSQVADINPGASGSMPNSNPEPMATIGDMVFVVANSGTTGNEVFGYFGSNFQLGRDIIAGSGTSAPIGLMGWGDSLFFQADDQVAGAELWKWDIYQDLTDSISVVSCGNWVSPGGTNYTNQGVYDFVDAIPSVNCPGCDSLITVHLVVTEPDTNLVVFACNEWTSPLGTTYTQTGNYVFTEIIPSQACPGVDSIINVDLTVTDDIYTTITVFSGVVFVNQPGAQYQWVDCDNNMAPIPGANDQDFLPQVDGNYACIISLTNCSDTTQCVFVESTWGVGLEDEADSKISVYPNPVENLLFIINATSNAILKLYDLDGRLVMETSLIDNKLDLSQLNRGFYVLQIIDGDLIFAQKIQKL